MTVNIDNTDSQSQQQKQKQKQKQKQASGDNGENGDNDVTDSASVGELVPADEPTPKEAKNVKSPKREKGFFSNPFSKSE